MTTETHERLALKGLAGWNGPMTTFEIINHGYRLKVLIALNMFNFKNFLKFQIEVETRLDNLHYSIEFKFEIQALWLKFK